MKIGITERGDAALDLAWRNASGVDGVILITKSPQVLLELPREKLPEPVIVHCTITGYGATVLEPGVAPWHETISAYERWVDRLGPERVVLRIDPIIPTQKGLDRALEVLRRARGRVRISFLDLYPHVCDRFKKAGLPIPWQGHAPIEVRQAALERLQEAAGREVEVCGEPGLKCTGCISPADLRALGLADWSGPKSRQRPACACLGVKTELLSNKHPCRHGCLYCYWK